jgi:predicted transposase YdaD
METDSFFCNLFKQLPQTLFELLGLPAELARWYRFDAVELKKSLRVDGLLQPTKRGLPLYVVEVQHYASAKYYANLFAKVFGYFGIRDDSERQ